MAMLVMGIVNDGEEITIRTSQYSHSPLGITAGLGTMCFVDFPRYYTLW